MKTKTKIVVAALAIGLFNITPVNAQEHSHAEKGHQHMEKAAYACTMKCEGDKTYEKAGSCPKCGMTLAKQEKMVKTYTCSMHPEVKSDKPGDCPKCGMKLIEKKMDMKKEEGHNHNHSH